MGKRDCVRSKPFPHCKGNWILVSEMIDAKVFVARSMQVNFNVTINAKTKEPVTQYEVERKECTRG